MQARYINVRFSPGEFLKIERLGKVERRLKGPFVRELVLEALHARDVRDERQRVRTKELGAAVASVHKPA